VIAIRLAWRNLQRNRRRTVLTSSALAIGLTVLIVQLGLLDGTDQQSINNLVAYDVAHVKAFAPGYMDQDLPGLDHTLSGVDSLLSLLDGTRDVVAATARLEMSGMLIHGGEELFTRVVGVDPVRDGDVFGTLRAVVEGRSIQDETPVALVGDRLASDIGLGVGDIVTLLVRSAPGALNTRTLPVVGILSSGHPKVDQFAVYVPLSLACDMALLPDAATEIAIRTERLKDSELVSRTLARIIPGPDWRAWDDLAGDFIRLARMKRTAQGIIIAVLALLAAVGIANTMIMAVHERTREIGTLRAFGFSSSLIGRIFLWEGMLIGLIAGSAAVIIGVAVVSYLGVHGISLEAYGDMDIGYPIRDAIYPVINAGSVISSFIFGLVLSLLASWGASRRAARGQVVRALREGSL